MVGTSLDQVGGIHLLFLLSSNIDLFSGWIRPFRAFGPWWKIPLFKTFWKLNIIFLQSMINSLSPHWTLTKSVTICPHLHLPWPWTYCQGRVYSSHTAMCKIISRSYNAQFSQFFYTEMVIPQIHCLLLLCYSGGSVNIFNHVSHEGVGEVRLLCPRNYCTTYNVTLT